MSQLPAVRVQAGLQLRTIAEIKETAQLLMSSGMFADTTDVAKACVKIIAGQEFGFTPYVSMTGIHLIQGKPTLSANLIAAAIKRTTKYNYRVVRQDAEACVIKFLELGEEIGEFSFTMKEAQQAGLAGKDIWRKFPKAMLFARTLSAGARTFCPDVFGGPVYAPEDFDAVIDDNGDVIEGVVKEVPKLKPAADSLLDLVTCGTNAIPNDTISSSSAKPEYGNVRTADLSANDPKLDINAENQAAQEQTEAAAVSVQSAQTVGKDQMAQLLKVGTGNGWNRKQISSFVCFAFKLEPGQLGSLTWKQWETAVKLIGHSGNKAGVVTETSEGKKLPAEKCFGQEESK